MRNTITLMLALSIAMWTMTGCQKDSSTDPDPNNPNNPGTQYSLGWFGLDEKPDEIPMTTYFGFGTGNLPDKYDLTQYLPPVGDQGSYGTCVAWAVSYNVKTAINAIDKQLSTEQLRDPSNQFSPKDLFVSIPDNQKGPDCNGTNFSPALDQLQSRGVATMATVPYTNLGSCSQSQMQQSWTSEAANNKIQYWRRIEKSVDAVKQNIAKNIPVIFGAKLADNFMTWNSDAVLSSNSSYDNVGIHAYHAMAIVGYDDSKGANGAFKVINSWGEGWGNRGFIWIDYNFMVNEFLDNLNGTSMFIATNQEGEESNDPPNNNPTTTEGVDLAAWVFEDFSTEATSGDPNERMATLNYYNIGTQTARSSANWNVYYIYYNAYDVNDYGVVFFDEFNTSIPQNTYDCPDLNNCVINVDIPSGSDFAWQAFGDYAITRTYKMPQITGEYYLMLFVDGGEAFRETNEWNNLFYTTEYPIFFLNGYGAKGQDSPGLRSGKDVAFRNSLEPAPENLAGSMYNTAVKEDNRNAYTPKELIRFFNAKSESGELRKKAYLLGDNDKQVFVKKQDQ